MDKEARRANKKVPYIPVLKYGGLRHFFTKIRIFILSFHYLLWLSWSINLLIAIMQVIREIISKTMMIPNRISLTRPKTNKAKMTASITQMIPINELFTVFESPCFIPLIKQTNSRKANIAPTITDILAIPVSESCKMLFDKKNIFISIFPFNYFYLCFLLQLRLM